MSQKLTEEELQAIQDLRSEANRLGAALGEFTYQKTVIEFELDVIKAGIKENIKQQQEQLRVLGEVYGDGTINFATGEIFPVEKQEQPA